MKQMFIIQPEAEQDELWNIQIISEVKIKWNPRRTERKIKRREKSNYPLNWNCWNWWRKALRLRLIWLWMTFSKTGNKERREVPKFGTSRRFCRLFPYEGSRMALPQTARKTVIRNQNRFWWACGPRKKGVMDLRFIFPIRYAGCMRKGVLRFAYKIRAVFPWFSAFWKPPPMTTKPFVLLNTYFTRRVGLPRWHQLT